MMLLPLLACSTTKIVSVPMRMTGEVVSHIPVVGPVTDGVLKTSADVVDLIPI